MSTKIYNGLKIHKSSLDQTFALFKNVRKDFIDFVYEDLSVVAINKMCAKINLIFLNKYLHGELNLPVLSDEDQDYKREYDAFKRYNLIENASNLFEEECYNKKNNDDLVVYPAQEGKDYCLGAYLFNKEKHMDFLFNKLKSTVFEYPYYNNTDPPEGIDDEEWEQRGLEWNTVMEGGEYHKHQGLTIQMIDYKSFYHTLSFNNRDKLNEIVLNKFNHQDKPSDDYYIDNARRVFMNYMENKGLLSQSFSETMKISSNAKEGVFQDEEQKSVFNTILNTIKSFDSRDFVGQKKLTVGDLYEKFKVSVDVNNVCLPQNSAKKSKSKI